MTISCNLPNDSTSLHDWVVHSRIDIMPRLDIQACATTSVFGSQLHASFWCRKRPIGFGNDLGSGLGSLPPSSTITASYQHDRIVSPIGDSSNKQGVSGNLGICRLRKIRERQLDESPLAII